MRTFVVESNGGYVGELLGLPTSRSGVPVVLEHGEYANATYNGSSFVAMVNSDPWLQHATPPDSNREEVCQFYYGSRV